jgi:hypothetical protein
MRSQSQIDEIKKFHSPPVQILNVLSKEKIKHLIEHYKSSEKIVKNTGPTISYVKEGDGIIDDFLPILREKFGDFKVRVAHFFEVTHPHIIHIDDDFKLSNAFKAFTVPLEIREGTDEDLSLIFFDQYYYHGPSKFVKGSNVEKLNVHYNNYITNYEQIESLSDTDLTDDQKKMLTHLNPQWYKGLSVQTHFKWKIGSILGFDSLQLHSASNFLDQGIKSKLGLSIFTIKE